MSSHFRAAVRHFEGFLIHHSLKVIAVHFLLGVGFRIDAPFLEGVPYFSRDEEARARATAAYRRNKNNYANIQIKDGDTESFHFMRRVQDEVTAWQSQGMVNSHPYFQRTKMDRLNPASAGRFPQCRCRKACLVSPHSWLKWLPKTPSSSTYSV